MRICRNTLRPDNAPGKISLVVILGGALIMALFSPKPVCYSDELLLPIFRPFSRAPIIGQPPPPTVGGEIWTGYYYHAKQYMKKRDPNIPRILIKR